MTKSDKQAVLLIHGIGEQRPMDTLRGFVDAVWTTDREVHSKFGKLGVFSKPDTVSGSFELRRLTTTQNRNEVRTDFFEFYWAHLMEGTSARDVLAWAKCLLIRSPATVPRQLLGAWVLLIALALVIMVFAVQTALPEEYQFLTMPKWLSALAGFVVAGFAMPIIRNIVGDAARYLNAAPNNVQRRQEIRTKGVEILEKLHAANYRRIIIVGHSLGSVIGYDILTYAWAKFSDAAEKYKDHPALDAIETAVANGTFDVNSYRTLQRQLFDELESANEKTTWRVTDFLTLGSPLVHASVLLAKDHGDLTVRQSSRELPTCPPQLEDGKKFSFPLRDVGRKLHHAAVFGPCRWTNLYFPAKFLIVGDVIGGPLAPVFGPGIRDVQVTTRLRSGFLSHTLYWTPDMGAAAASHIVELRRALNLLDSDSATDAEKDTHEPAHAEQ
jgi:hypothetical protein